MSQYQQSLNSGRTGLSQDLAEPWKSKLVNVYERVKQTVREKRLTAVTGASASSLDSMVGVEELQKLIKGSPPDVELNSRERILLSDLKRALDNCKVLLAQIEASLERTNLVELSGLWNQISQNGVA